MTNVFPALESVLVAPRLRPHAESIRHIVASWIQDEERVKEMPIEAVLRPIVEFLDGAPGLQPVRPSDRVVLASEVEEHFSDLGLRTELLPCTVRALQQLRYTRHELYDLDGDDVLRLVKAIRAVRKHLGVDGIPVPKAIRQHMEDGRFVCCIA